MIPGNFIKVIHELANQCDPLDLVWAFTGSLNLALWGFDLIPHDIDLETDRYGAEQFEHLHVSRAVWSLHMRESDFMRSWFGRYDFEGVQVEIMGDCQYHLADGSWVSQRPLIERIRTMTWRDLSLPLLDLADELESCKLMGRSEKAESIRVFLAGHPEITTKQFR